MKLSPIFYQKIMLAVLGVAMVTMATHAITDNYNRKKCLEMAKTCENGFTDYSYSSYYIGRCNCRIECAD